MDCLFCSFPLRPAETVICFGPGGWGMFHSGCAPVFDRELLEGPAHPFQAYGDNRFTHCLRREWLLEPSVQKQVMALAEQASAGPPPPELGLALPE
jgi:hypothetical protein